MSYLITLAEFEGFYPSTESGLTTTIDNVLIPAVDNEINIYLNGTGTTTQPTLVTQTFSEVYNGTGNNFLRLRNKPITSITSITFDYNRTSPQTFSGSNFIYEANNGLVYFNPAISSGTLPSVFYEGNQNIQVIYVAGYAVASVPQSIKRAAAMMIQKFINLSDPKFLLTSKRLDQLTLTYGKNWLDINDELNTDIKRILDRFKPVRYVF